MMENGLSHIAPFVMFRSFVEALRGEYYLQDRVSGLRQYEGFMEIKRKGADWRGIMRQYGIRFMIFRISDPAEAAVFRLYLVDGALKLQNRDWAVLQLEA